MKEKLPLQPHLNFVTTLLSKTKTVANISATFSNV